MLVVSVYTRFVGLFSSFFDEKRNYRMRGLGFLYEAGAQNEANITTLPRLNYSSTPPYN